MSRRLSAGSGEIEPGTPLRFASPFLVSPSKASTLLEESGSEKSDSTELALLGDNTCSRSPARGGVKIEIPKAEADTYFIWALNNPPPDFETIADARGKAYRDSIKLKAPSPSITRLPTQCGSVVTKTEGWLADLEDDEPAKKDHPRSSDEETVRHSEDSQLSIPKSQDDNIRANSIHNDDDHCNETAIVDVIWVLLLTFSTVVRGTSRLVLFSILVPLSFVKRTGLKDPMHQGPYLGSTAFDMEQNIQSSTPKRRGSRWSLYRPAKGERLSSTVKADTSDTAGPVLHDGQPLGTKGVIHSSDDDSNVGCTTGIPSFTGRVKQQNNENKPPERIQEESITPASTKQGIPKSRTFNVLSNLTHTFSRSSLLSHSTTSSQDLQNPSSTATAKSSRSSLSSRFGRKAMDHDVDPATEVPESAPTREEAPPPLPNNPRFVSTAMPSAYWAGRFSSLHDRFHNEILGPRNLNLIIEAHTFLSTMSSDLNNSTSTPSPPTASAFNNPSTSVYASSRIVPTRDLNSYTPAKRHSNADQLGLKTTDHRHIPHYRRCIPHSATTDAILQTSRKSSTYVSERNPAVYKTVQHEEISHPKVPSPSMIPTRVIPRSESSRILPRRPLPEPPVSESSRVLPRRPLPELPVSESSGTIHIHPPDSYNSNNPLTNYNNYPSTSFRMKNTDRPNRIMSESQAKAQKDREVMLRRVAVADATALTDDDNRCRRVFVHLEACCLTDEARNSLYVWQQDYARRTKREVLLPKGGTMYDPRSFRNSVFGRSLFGSRRSMGSLPSGSGGGIVTTGLNVDLGQPQSEVRPSKTDRSLLQVPRRVFTHGRSVSMKADSLEPSSYGHRLERHGTVRGVDADNEVRKGRYQHRMSLA